MSNEWYDIDSWQWVDNNNAQWGFSVVPILYTGLNQIWTDDKYVYAATTSGLDIIDIETESRKLFITVSGGYSSVWSDNEEVFVGDLTNGIKVFTQASIDLIEVPPLLSDYARAPLITSDRIKYIHGNSNKLICCTIEGVDIIRRDSNYITHIIIAGANKCFVTPNYDYYYYTVDNIDNWILHRLNGNNSNWIDPDIIYTTGSGFLSDSTCIKDFYVTEHTSMSGVNNTLFLSTDYGVYVYDEGTGAFIVFTTAV